MNQKIIKQMRMQFLVLKSIYIVLAILLVGFTILAAMK